MKKKQIDSEVMEEKKNFQRYIGYPGASNHKQNDIVQLLIQEYKKKLRSI